MGQFSQGFEILTQDFKSMPLSHPSRGNKADMLQNMHGLYNAGSMLIPAPKQPHLSTLGSQEIFNEASYTKC